MEQFFEFLSELEAMATRTNAKFARYRFEYHGGTVEIIYRVKTNKKQEKAG